MDTHKKLYKSSTNKVIAGVIGGAGEYLDMDATVLRLIYVVIAVVTGFVPAVVAYIIAYFIVPEKPRHTEAAYSEKPADKPAEEPKAE